MAAKTNNINGLSFEDEVNIIFTFIKDGKYPAGISDNLKRSIRRRAQVFTLNEDATYLLFQGRGGNDRRKVIQRKDEQRRKISCIHEGAGGGHFGRDKTKEKVLKRYYWRSIGEDVIEYVRTCATCQESDKRFHKKAGMLHPIPVTAVWDQVGIDMIGPLPETKNGNRYIITLCDYFSKWPEAAAVKDKSATTVANFLYDTMARYGCMKIVISDQGREFVNNVNKALFAITQVEHRVSSSYHPQTNGLDERFNQTLQNALVKVVNEDQNDWDEKITSILIGYRTSKHASTGYSPFEVMFVREAKIFVDVEDGLEDVDEVPGSSDIHNVVTVMNRARQVIKDNVGASVKQAQEKQSKDYNKRHMSNKTFPEGTLVWLRNAKQDARKGGKLEKPWLGPYKVGRVHEKGLHTLVGKDGQFLKKKFHYILLEDFHAGEPQSQSDEKQLGKEHPNQDVKPKPNRQEETKSGRKIKRLPNVGNSCYMATSLQLLKGSGILDVDGHCSGLLDTIKHLFGAAANPNVSWEPHVKVLKELLPQFNSTCQEDAMEFLLAVYTSGCDTCNQTPCTILDKHFFMHTTNEMKCTSCGRIWHSGTNSYPVIPIYPSYEEHRSNIRTHLEIFFDCKVVPDGLCDSCGAMGDILVHPYVQTTPEVITVQISRWNSNGTDKNFYSVQLDEDLVIAGVTYNLYGVMIHEGSTINNGHYSCLRKDEHGWHRISDGKVSKGSNKLSLDDTKVCGVFYHKAIDQLGAKPEESDDEGDIPVNMESPGLNDCFSDIIQQLIGIMDGKINSKRHDTFMAGEKVKSHLVGVGAVSVKVKEMLVKKIRAHFTDKPKELGPIIPKNLFKVRQQFYFRFPQHLLDRLEKLRKFEVQLAYLNDVLVPHAVECAYQICTGCSREDAIADCCRLIA